MLLQSEGRAAHTVATQLQRIAKMLPQRALVPVHHSREFYSDPYSLNMCIFVYAYLLEVGNIIGLAVFIIQTVLQSVS